MFGCQAARSERLSVFPAGRNWRLAEAKEGSRRKNCTPEDQDLGFCDMLSPLHEPKWKSWKINLCGHKWITSIYSRAD